jgi:hypothetical protein
MAIRFPLVVVKSQQYLNETGTSSLAGGIPVMVNIPQDTDNVLLKLTASTVGGGVSAVFQTTDDGGTTWYDVGRTSVVSNANNDTAQFLSIPVINAGVGTAVLQTTSSVYTAGIGNSPASALGQNRMSGMPLLSQTARAFLILSGNHTAATGSQITVEVKVNSQSATA